MKTEGTETSTAAVTQLLKGLVGAGYVDKQEATDDRRKVRVKLTAAGRARHRQREANIQQWMQQALAQYSDAELSATTQILRQLGALHDAL